MANNTASKKRLTETTYQDTAPRIDAENGILYGVKLLGSESRNGRRYTKQAMQEAVGLYEGRKIYVNHPKPDEMGEDRQFESWAGESQDPEVRDDGIYGNVRLRKKSGYFEGIIEAAEHFPMAVGFSHVADGESRYEGDTEIVESIKEVFSVDIVTDPATTAGFFESRRKPKKTVKQSIESLPDGPQRRRLVEMMGDYDDFGDMGAASSSQPTDALGEIATMCRTLIQMLGEALVAKNTPPPAPIVPAETPPPGDQPPGDPNEDEEMTEEDKQKINAFESLQRENSELKASKMLLESGRQPTSARMKALANCENDEEREELLESWPTAEQSARPAHSPSLIETDTGFPIDNPEKFAALLR